MKKILFSCAVLGSLLFSSCAMVKSPVSGFFYTDVVAGNSATSNNLGTKVGRASAQSILGLVATGDASIQTAANSAGITKISHIDERANSILGIIGTYEIIVYGD